MEILGGSASIGPLQVETVIGDYRLMSLRERQRYGSGNGRGPMRVWLG